MKQGPDSAASQDIKLYVKAPKVYPRETDGRYARLRVSAAWVLLGLFYVLPWVQLNDQQIVLFDLPARQFHVFGLVFWPQDFFLLALLLAIAAIVLFFVTALAGRVWCGYACPQTVWTEVFLWMERFVEGPRNKRMRLDAGPWTAEKIRKKSLKQFLFITFAFWTGLTFVGFFTPMRELTPSLFAFNISGWETFWIGFYGLATYGNAGYLREQVCKYMCPYARFQSAMFDSESLVVAYDEQRGEPRGKRRKDADKEALGLGDCIECMGCVQVCPTGIDIRDGLQIECIACAACADVCDQVMDRMGYPRGLIRYTTEAALAGRKSRILRPRVLIYTGILLALVTLFGLILTGRDMVDLDVLRDRTALYRMAGERIENPFALKVTNRSDQTMRLQLAAEGLSGLKVVSPATGFEVPPGEVSNRPMTLSIPARAAGPGMHDVEIRLSNAVTGEAVTTAETGFYVPPETR